MNFNLTILEKRLQKPIYPLKKDKINVDVIIKSMQNSLMSVIKNSDWHALFETLLFNLNKIASEKIDDDKIKKLFQLILMAGCQSLKHVIDNDDMISSFFSLIFFFRPNLFLQVYARYIFMVLQANKNVDIQMKILLHDAALKVIFNQHSEMDTKERRVKITGLLSQMFISLHSEQSSFDLIDVEMLENMWTHLDHHFFTMIAGHYIFTGPLIGFCNLLNFLLEKNKQIYDLEQLKLNSNYQKNLSHRAYSATPILDMAEQPKIQDKFTSDVNLCFAIPQGQLIHDLPNMSQTVINKVNLRQVQTEFTLTPDGFTFQQNVEEFATQAELFEKYPPHHFDCHLFYFYYYQDDHGENHGITTIYDFNQSDKSSKSFFLERLLNPYQPDKILFSFDQMHLFNHPGTR